MSSRLIDRMGGVVFASTCGLVLILLPTAASAEPPTLTTPSSLCVGQSLDNCVAAIKGVFNVDDQDLARSLALNDRRDVNGKPFLASRGVIFDIWQNARANLMIADLSLTADNKVTFASIGVRGFALMAKTEEEYDATGLLPAMQALFSASCWAGDKIKLYQWFENSVKPVLIYNPTKTEITADGAKEDRYVHTPAIKFCGEYVYFSDLSGHDTNDISEDNPHGMFASESIDVSAAPIAKK